MSDTPTAILRDQHRKILKIADVLEEVLAHEPEPGRLDFDAVEDCVTFIRLFADALHHGKEEERRRGVAALRRGGAAMDQPRTHHVPIHLQDHDIEDCGLGAARPRLRRWRSST